MQSKLNLTTFAPFKMKKISLFILIILLLGSCKTDYEKIRTSNDPKLMYEAANQYYESGNYLNAQALYNECIPFYRGKEEAEDLYYKFADTHYQLGEYLLAGHYFKNFASSFYASPNKEEAEFMSAYSKYKLSPSHKLDQSYSAEAIEALQTFINTYPESDKVEECGKLINEIRAKLELKAFEEGRLYYDLKNYNSSIKSFENMLKDFPDTSRSEEIRYLILQSSINWAINSVFEKKEERLEETLKKYNLFKKKFPNSGYAEEVEKVYNKYQEEIKILENVRLKNASSEY